MTSLPSRSIEMILPLQENKLPKKEETFSDSSYPILTNH